MPKKIKQLFVATACLLITVAQGQTLQNKDAQSTNLDNAGQYYAGIEIGAKGVKYSIIKARREDGQIVFTPVQDGSKNTSVIDFTQNAIIETGDAVKIFFDTVTSFKEKIPADHVFIAVSSGVKQEADKQTGTGEKLLQAIKEAVPAYRKKIEFLTPCRESELTIRGVVPSAYLFSGSLTDIGSGNTKGGYCIKGQNAECISIPWGTATLAKKINGNMASTFYTDSVLPVIRSEIERKPGMTKYAVSYCTGGIYWAMCNYLYPQNVKKDICEFTKKDIEKLLKLASSEEYELLTHPNLSSITDNEILQGAQKQISRSQATFNKNQIIAGGMLMKGIMDEMERNKKPENERHYYFVRNGYVGWISGYIASSIEEEHNKTK